MNTYNSETGATICESCSEDQFSFKGAEKCLDRPLCTENDYYKHNQECGLDGMREVVYKWLEPQICQGGVELPEKTTESCQFCGTGYELNDQNVCEKVKFTSVSEWILKWTEGVNKIHERFFAREWIQQQQQQQQQQQKGGGGY